MNFKQTKPAKITNISEPLFHRELDQWYVHVDTEDVTEGFSFRMSFEVESEEVGRALIHCIAKLMAKAELYILPRDEG